MASATKQAACFACRRSKIKCRRGPDAVACERCVGAGIACNFPGTFHVGRVKGVKNKRSGLEKALFQIEEAIRKSKNDEDDGTASEIYRLLSRAKDTAPDSASNPEPADPPSTQYSEQQTPSHEEQLALDDAENPLQLLARASDLRLASPRMTGSNDAAPFSRGFFQGGNGTSNVHRFFMPIKTKSDGRDSRRDFEAGEDPIDLGLVTMEEAETLLAFFFDKLAHTRWGLDPYVHTLSFIRARSSFLLTSVLAASSLFMPSAAALSKRLSNHQKALAHAVITRRLRSVEIVLAFLVNVPWMPPGAHSADDDTGLYISVALSIALDLSLNKVVVPSTSFEEETLKRTPKADCIDGRKALAMDGFDDVDPNTEWGRRLLRRRERAWIALFVLDRGVCLARGRNYSVPITPLVKFCDRWHSSDITTRGDGAMVSMTVLRRDLDDLFVAVRLRCDSYGASDVGSKVAREIQTNIEYFYDQWLAIWTYAIGEGEQRALPPYVDILITHTRLSTYSGVINHPTAPLEVKRLFRASALSSAINVMRAAIQGESRLMSMPNNTATMISFAACVALNLTTPTPGISLNLAPSIGQLIHEAAAVLERIGSTPSHRGGASLYYGEYLRELIKQAPVPYNTVDMQSGHTQHNSHGDSSQAPHLATHAYGASTDPQQQHSMSQHVHDQTYGLWSEPLHFSTMSDDQIQATILNAGQGLDTTLSDLGGLGDDGFAWMDWMNPPEFGF